MPIVTTVHSDYRLDYLGSPLKQYTLGTANAIALRFLDFYQPVADRMHARSSSAALTRSAL